MATLSAATTADAAGPDIGDLASVDFRRAVTSWRFQCPHCLLLCPTSEYLGIHVETAYCSRPLVTPGTLDSQDGVASMMAQLQERGRCHRILQKANEALQNAAARVEEAESEAAKEKRRADEEKRRADVAEKKAAKVAEENARGRKREIEHVKRIESMEAALKAATPKEMMEEVVGSMETTVRNLADALRRTQEQANAMQETMRGQIAERSRLAGELDDAKATIETLRAELEEARASATGGTCTSGALSGVFERCSPHAWAIPRLKSGSHASNERWSRACCRYQRLTCSSSR